MLNPVYRRILHKMSAEVLADNQVFGISPSECQSLINKITPVKNARVQHGIIIGGGNIFGGHLSG